MLQQHAEEVSGGERFKFGANWRRFLSVLDERRIVEAERSLAVMLETDSLQDKRFLDIGCGSGLFSLAARRLGARVHSLDYDPEAVACAQILKQRYFPDVEDWTIETGSVLNMAYLRSLGQFDIVYAWGVLHHTGDMWQALENAGKCVKLGGKLFIAIYNDQGIWSKLWRGIKRVYNALPSVLQTPFMLLVMLPRELLYFGYWLVKGNPGRYVRTWTDYRSVRGMSRWHDMVDWVGGYPFEVAAPKEIFAFYRQRGFTLLISKTVGKKSGCNEYVFQKAVDDPNRP